jgi:hypothetical protein
MVSGAYQADEINAALNCYLGARPLKNNGDQRNVRATTTGVARVRKILAFMHEDEKHDSNIPTMYMDEAGLQLLPEISKRNIELGQVIAEYVSVKEINKAMFTCIKKLSSDVQELKALVQSNPQLNPGPIAPANKLAGGNSSATETKVAQLIRELKSKSSPVAIRITGTENVVAQHTQTAVTAHSSAQAPPLPSPHSVTHSTPSSTYSTPRCLSPSPHASPQSSFPPLPLPHHTAYNISLSQNTEADATPDRRYADAAAQQRTVADEPRLIANKETAFTDASSTRRNRGRKNKTGVYIGTGTFSGHRAPKEGLEKLFVSLPFRRFPLQEIKDRTRDATGAELKIKKRTSTKGHSTPFEIYGDKSHIAKIRAPDFWERGTVILRKSLKFRLPKDYAEDDYETEKQLLLLSKNSVRLQPPQ